MTLSATTKASAHQFLTDLQRSIARGCPKGTDMEVEIRRTIAAAREDTSSKHLRSPEGAFLNRFVVPILFDQIRESAGLSDEQARQALLNEYHRSMPRYSTHSPIRATKHPFRKALGLQPDSIYASWKDPERNFGLTQSCPDFATRAPFAHAIMFEGKYYAGGTKDYARRELVKDIYQAFFYRGLPPVAATRRGHPEWNYDYVCLLAFDSSPTGSLKQAWDELDAKVRSAFWDGANIFVMILGGEGRRASC